MYRLVVIEKRNTATDAAALIIPSVGSNRERHPRLQRFMLANDSTTIAVEVPIWLDEPAISAIERAVAHEVKLGAMKAELIDLRVVELDDADQPRRAVELAALVAQTPIGGEAGMGGQPSRDGGFVEGVAVARG